MTTLYLVCLFVGTVGFVVALARKKVPAMEVPLADAGCQARELTEPGARIEPSDDFAVEGGAGGAEGEGGSPAYQDGADGGIGGAEGGSDGTIVHRPLLSFAAAVGAFLAGFGGAGYLAESSAWAAGLKGVVLGVIAGLVSSVLGLSAVRFVQRQRDAEQ